MFNGNILKTLYSINKPLSKDGIYSLLKINNDEDREKVDKIIDDEVKKYNLIYIDDGYIPIYKTKYKKGIFSGYKLGGGKVTIISSYFDNEGVFHSKKETQIIKAEYSNTAIDEDVVLIKEKKNKKGTYYEVEKIIDRRINTILGEVFEDNGKYYIKSNDKKKKDLTIVLDDEAIVGDKVIASLDTKIDDNIYTGSIKKVLSNKFGAEAEFIELAYKLGIEAFFSDEALEELECIPNSVNEEDKEGLIDLTDMKIFTIDGKDTKDMDDAISIEILDNGNYLLGVHIANPTFYIKEGSHLDKEAISRGTSVYAYNQVIPMLPPKLSNGICSLNPHVDRLAISTFMEIDKEGNVVKFLIDETVIKSKKKMNYDDVNKILEEIFSNINKDIINNNSININGAIGLMKEWYTNAYTNNALSNFNNWVCKLPILL